MWVCTQGLLLWALIDMVFYITESSYFAALYQFQREEYYKNASGNNKILENCLDIREIMVNP